MFLESSAITTYKWDQGVYSLKDMVILVRYNQITPEQFFEITRYNYNTIEK